MNNATPYEKWPGAKPKVKHLRVFGSVCYTQVPQKKRTKLDKWANVGILVGYNEVTKGYRIYNIRLYKIIVSRDAKVDEKQGWN